jgi:hypothetical protein
MVLNKTLPSAVVPTYPPVGALRTYLNSEDTTIVNAALAEIAKHVSDSRFRQAFCNDYGAIDTLINICRSAAFKNIENRDLRRLFAWIIAGLASYKEQPIHKLLSVTRGFADVVRDLAKSNDSETRLAASLVFLELKDDSDFIRQGKEYGLQPSDVLGRDWGKFDPEGVPLGIAQRVGVLIGVMMVHDIPWVRFAVMKTINSLLELVPDFAPRCMEYPQFLNRLAANLDSEDLDIVEEARMMFWQLAKSPSFSSENRFMNIQTREERLWVDAKWFR